MTDQAPQSSLCTLCKEPLRIGAIKCVTCGGFQGKWFFLNLGVPTLGLLVALISVISLSATLIAPLFTSQKSDVRVSFQYFRDGEAYFVASNSGNRPGTIGEAWLDFTGGPQPERHYLLERSGNTFIPPASSRRLSFAIPCGDNSPQIHYQRSEGFGSHPISATQLVVSIVQFDGEPEYQSFPIDEIPGISAINDALGDCLQERLRGASAPASGAEGNVVSERARRE